MDGLAGDLAAVEQNHRANEQVAKARYLGVDDSKPDETRAHPETSRIGASLARIRRALGR